MENYNSIENTIISPAINVNTINTTTQLTTKNKPNINTKKNSIYNSSDNMLFRIYMKQYVFIPDTLYKYALNKTISDNFKKKV